MSEAVHRCLFCGGERSGPDHRCDGRQGRVEADAAAFEASTAFLPRLAAGIDPATYATSAEAADAAAALKAQQRARVFAAIRAAGAEGRTDDELQTALSLDGSSERPRRWELWRLSQIAIARDADGQAIKRPTSRGRRAVVWIAVA